ncbi:MAG TPA: GDSL-type esterase/lipase family protein [Candidatus Limnocylindria bacterium]|nr:GDSL-type esterase/lipase family protein [Candidatus Limnocylindria bacterium]
MFQLPRTTFAVALCLVGALILTEFRLWLYWERRADVKALTRRQKLKLFWIGIRLDAVIVSRGCLPVVVAALALPDALFVSSRIFFDLYLALLYFTLFFAEIAGIYFFRFYDFRPNYLVFEHGVDREVLKTVVKAYPLVRIFLLSAIGAWLAVIALQFLADNTATSDHLWLADRVLTLLWLLFVGFASRGTLDHRPLNPSLASFTTHRIANEIAGCGIFNLLYEWSQRAKHQFAALKSITQLPAADAAIERCRKVFARDGQFTDDGPNPLVRQITNPVRATPLNVVLVVMESFTGRLTGCLGGVPALSPELDRIAQEGLLLEHCYATGERTIQGLEAAVCSFPPLPGEGVVKRPQARQNFFTLANVLQALLVLELGGNDGLRGLPPETTRQNLQAIIERTQKKYPQAKIILAGMKVPPNMGADYANKFGVIYPDLAKKNKALLVPFILENVGGVRELNLPDGIHPTAKGHELVAANVWKVLEPVLQGLVGK